MDIKYLSVLSKELDRANRQYISALQTLYSLKQPPLSVSLKTDTAYLANQQVIQTNL